MKILVSALSAIALFSAVVPSRALDIAASGAASVYEFLPGPRSTLYVINEYSAVPGHSFDSYIYFDLSSLTGDPVASAVLKLRTDANTAAGFITGFGATPPAESFFTLSDADASWFGPAGTPNTDMNWANRPQSGGAFSVPISFHFTSDGAGGYVDSWIEVDVTSIVNSWIQTPGSNFGFRLSSLTEPTFSAAAFVGTSGGAMAPQLEIVAVPEAGTTGLVVGGLVVLAFVLRRSRPVLNP